MPSKLSGQYVLFPVLFEVGLVPFFLTKITFSRFAFVDLTAGPFSWGPAVGGDGVRTEHTLPNVAKTVGAVAGQFFFSFFFVHMMFHYYLFLRFGACLLMH